MFSVGITELRSVLDETHPVLMSRENHKAIMAHSWSDSIYFQTVVCDHLVQNT